MTDRKTKPKSARTAMLAITAGMWSVFLTSCFYVDHPSYAATVGAQRCETEVPGPDDDIFTAEGKRGKIVDGDAYLCKDGRWIFQNTLMRPGFKDIHVRKTPQGWQVFNARTGDKALMATEFSSGFEAPTFLDLFRTGGWSKTLLLSPRADSDEKYMQLNQRLMKGGQFLDNRIDLERDNVHSGNSAVRFYAVPPGWRMVTSKSLLEKSDLYFAKGDDVWFSAWYYLAEGIPSTLIDFDTQWLQGRPGIRLFVRTKGGIPYATMELKFIVKPQYNQFEFPLPTKKWTHIKLHLHLSNHDDGLMEIWQDDRKILSTHGQTLPLHDTVYNAMLVGITSTSMKTVLLVDDVKVSNKPF